jgi:hypothetical protein
MALRKVTRRRCPTDGSWFRTEAHLDSILRSMSRDKRRSDDMEWPNVGGVWVPIWARMEKYKAQETKAVPDGMIWGPIIKIGSWNSPEIRMFGHHHSCGLSTDWNLDQGDAPDDKRWIYAVIDGDLLSGGEDVSFYNCSACKKSLYRDDRGLRDHNSATIMDGGLVCRECEWTGLVASAGSQKQIERCQKLADYIGGDAAASFKRNLDHLSEKSYGNNCQTQVRVWPEDQFSFTWSRKVREAGETQWRNGMHGGLIQHGPAPKLEEDGTFTFTVWDYELHKLREATQEEIDNIRWSIHT